MVMDGSNVEVHIGDGQDYYVLEGLVVSSLQIESRAPRQNNVVNTAWDAVTEQTGQQRLQLDSRGMIHDAYADILLRNYALASTYCPVQITLDQGHMLECLTHITNYQCTYPQDEVARYRLRFENAGDVQYISN